MAKQRTSKIPVPGEIYELVVELTRVRDANRVLAGWASNDPKVVKAMQLLSQREDELTGRMA